MNKYLSVVIVTTQVVAGLEKYSEAPEPPLMTKDVDIGSEAEVHMYIVF